MAIEPVSSRDLRLDSTLGQPPETAKMNFEGSRSTLWVTVSLTDVPSGSSSMTHSDAPSALSSGFIWCCQRIASRRGGSASTISPASQTWPSPDTSFHGEPAVKALSARMPNQYCSMNFGSVSADHSFSGVVRMEVTYRQVELGHRFLQSLFELRERLEARLLELCEPALV